MVYSYLILHHNFVSNSQQYKTITHNDIIDYINVTWTWINHDAYYETGHCS